MSMMELSSVWFTWVLDATVTASILCIIVFGIQSVLGQRLTPGWRFALWLPVLLRLLLPTVPESPVGIFNMPRWIEYGASAAEPTASPLPHSSMPALPAEPVPGANSTGDSELQRLVFASPLAAAPKLTFRQVIPIVWALGAAALLFRLLAGALWLHILILRSCSVPDPKSLKLISELASQLNLFWKPTVIETPLIHSPCLFGFFRPMILLPTHISQRLTQSELSHVLLHELAHIKRGDLYLNWCMAIVQVVHWFNPLIWLMLRRMRIERELACDRMVLDARAASPAEARAYGQTLLKLLHDFHGRRSPVTAVGIIEEKQAATMRLRQIARFSSDQRGIWKLGAALLVTIITVGLSNAETDQRAAKEDFTLRSDDVINQSQERWNSPAVTLEEIQHDYTRQKKNVKTAQERLEQLRTEFRVSELDELLYQTNRANTVALLELKNQIDQAHRNDRALLDHLRGLTRPELRSALPTVLPSTDKFLASVLLRLQRTKDQYAAARTRHGEDDPEVQRFSNTIAALETQVESRIDQILSELEVRTTIAARQSSLLASELAKGTRFDAMRRDRLLPYFAARRSLEDAQRILDTIFMRIVAEKVDAKTTRGSTSPQSE